MKQSKKMGHGRYVQQFSIHEFKKIVGNISYSVTINDRTIRFFCWLQSSLHFSLYKINDQIESFAEHLDQIHRLTFLGDVLVMVTVSGCLLFVDSQTLLPIRVTVHTR